MAWIQCSASLGGKITCRVPFSNLCLRNDHKHFEALQVASSFNICKYLCCTEWASVFSICQNLCNVQILGLWNHWLKGMRTHGVQKVGISLSPDIMCLQWEGPWLCSRASACVQKVPGCRGCRRPEAETLASCCQYH